MVGRKSQQRGAHFEKLIKANNIELILDKLNEKKVKTKTGYCYTEKMPCDFVGSHYGRTVYIEAKAGDKNYLAAGGGKSGLKEHQVNELLNRYKCGNKIVLLFANYTNGIVYRFQSGLLVVLLQQISKGERKSIKGEDFENFAEQIGTLYKFNITKGWFNDNSANE